MTKILIADDESMVRTVLALALRREGYQVLEADGAGAALELIGRHDDIALVLLDFHMPGLSGPDLARRIVEGGRNRTRIAFMTGFDPRYALPSDFSDHPVLSKPFTAARATDFVRACLDGPPTYRCANA